MVLSAVLSVALATLLQTPVSETPAAIVARATRAVEDDSVSTVAAEWTARLARNPTDRAAALGLATLASLTYEYRRADSLFGGLAARDGERPDVFAAHARFGWGRALRFRGFQARADEAFERAILEARATGDTKLEAEVLVWNAAVRVRTGGPRAARGLLERARSLIPATDARLLATYHCGRAEIYVLTSAPAGAAAALGAEFARRAGDRRMHSVCLLHSANDLARTGNIDSALAVYAEAIAERRRTRDRARVAAALQWRGFLLRDIGAYGDARRDLLEAVAEGEASQNLAAMGFALVNLAILSLDVGDLSSRAEYSVRATRIFDEIGDRYGLAVSRGLEGAFALAARSPEAAREAYEGALVASEAGGFGPIIMASRIGLAQAALAEGDWDAAERELGLARAAADARGLTEYEAALRYNSGTLRLRQGNFSRAEADLRAGLAVTPKWQGFLRYQLGARLAEVYASRGDAERAEAQLTVAFDALDTWRQTLDEDRLRVLAFQVSQDATDPDLGIATVVATIASSGRVGAAFRIAERRRARELLDRLVRADALRPGHSRPMRPTEPLAVAPPATVAEVAAALPDDSTALLEFVTGRGGEPTTLFTITQAGATALVLPAEDSLAPAIARFGALLEGGGDTRALARELAAALLDPALTVLGPAIHRLLVVPDGALHHVPFDALVTEDGRFLLERFSVALVPSATVAIQLSSRDRTAGEPRAFVVADPTFARETNARRDGDAVFPAAFAGEGALPRLAASAEEARVVQRYVPLATVLRRREASEARLKREPLPSYRILHFATHALVDESALTRTALVLAAGEGEDGLVGPGELAQLRLNADLVILSACRTAGGQLVRGEGLQGLTSAFLHAGARSVLATRWPIGDRATVRLVESFYRELAAGRTVAEALREAQLHSLRDGRPPVEWAAFTVIGDPTVRIALPPPEGTKVDAWAVTAVGGLLLCGAALAYWLYRFSRRNRPAAERP